MTGQNDMFSDSAWNFGALFDEVSHTLSSGIGSIRQYLSSDVTKILVTSLVLSIIILQKEHDFLEVKTNLGELSKLNGVSDNCL